MVDKLADFNEFASSVLPILEDFCCNALFFCFLVLVFVLLFVACFCLVVMILSVVSQWAYRRFSLPNNPDRWAVVLFNGFRFSDPTFVPDGLNPEVYAKDKLSDYARFDDSCAFVYRMYRSSKVRLNEVHDEE